MIVSMRIDDTHFYLDHAPGFACIARFVEPDIGCLYYCNSEEFWVFVECLTEYVSCNKGHASEYVRKIKEGEMIEIIGEDIKIEKNDDITYLEPGTKAIDLDKLVPNKPVIPVDTKPIVTELHSIYKELHELNKNLRRVK